MRITKKKSLAIMLLCFVTVVGCVGCSGVMEKANEIKESVADSFKEPVKLEDYKIIGTYSCGWDDFILDGTGGGKDAEDYVSATNMLGGVVEGIAGLFGGDIDTENVTITFKKNGKVKLSSWGQDMGGTFSINKDDTEAEVYLSDSDEPLIVEIHDGYITIVGEGTSCIMEKQ